MKIFLKNIGGIGEASIELKGITVIAGENNTGKSTVGKALFAVFNSFFNIEAVIESERIQSISNILESGLVKQGNMLMESAARYTVDDKENYLSYSELASVIVKNSEPFRNVSDQLKEVILKTILKYEMKLNRTMNKPNFEKIVNRIEAVINVTDNDIIETVVDRKLNVEFNSQINNIFSDVDGELMLQNNGRSVIIKIRDNHVKKVDSEICLYSEAVYLDDPFVLDQPKSDFNARLTRYADHKEHLREKLFGDLQTNNVVDEIIVNRKFKDIYEKINSVCSGDILKSKKSGLQYMKKDSDKYMDIRNISTRLKTFVILKMLLQNGTIGDNGTIILDEPEIHLHPEWQLIFAELIVLIQKEFGMNILLNTHSPYFLNAIEVYSAK